MIVVTSTAFTNSGAIPKKYSYGAENFSPPLRFVGIPHLAKSLVLIVEDPDAPNGIWTHWLLFNIDPDEEELKENRIPQKAVRARNDFQSLDYCGPAPPSGTHRYYFRVFALDTVLSVPEGAKREAVEQAMKGHILDRGALIGTFTKI